MGQLPKMVAPDRSFTAFSQTYPDYARTHVLDTMRATDFARLDETGQVYLDYTGGSLYPASLVRDHAALLQGAVFGNPHSINPTSARSTHHVEAARAAVLEFFRADPEEYVVIFTPNASGALRLVGESYPFEVGSHFLQISDNHNSVNGLREFAKAKGAAVRTTVNGVDLQIDEAALRAELAERPTAPSLFAYPAQSNFTGVQHSLRWIAQAQELGWDVLLDAAAFAPTNRLDLSRYHPDFVPLSFYKLFGWPTGVGCLLARRPALARLRRPWFAGGTIWAVSVQADWHVMASDGEAFEDGTVNYLSLPAIPLGLRYLKRLGLSTIHRRVMCLTSWLLTELTALRHSNGRPMVEIYGPHNTAGRGATIAFNFLDPDGRIVDERLVDQAAATAGLSLRTGCFCNPGSGEVAFGLAPAKLAAGYSDGRQVGFDEYLSVIGLQSAGAVRVSLGLASNFADVAAFLDFAETTFRDQPQDPSALAPRQRC
ncbi:MAG TPA: aminotransferase class V-fold PLP-dependent enzyme [Candidatus Saccharimonadia bacterium]|nr:aminotransferase class V-fold PLP-dependent enzyme [Candidatus Saccharimonadia bacterium]